jgi:hypothetical protein
VRVSIPEVLLKSIDPLLSISKLYQDIGLRSVVRLALLIVMLSPSLIAVDPVMIVGAV